MKPCAHPASGFRALLLLLPALLAVAPAASASSFNAFFDGPVVDGRNQGLLDPTAATMAGLELVDLDVFSPMGTLTQLSQSADGMSLDTVESPTVITSEWVVQNVLGTPLVGEAWLLFTNVGNPTREIGGQEVTTSYDSLEVALSVDEDWVVVETERDGVTVYYVGISLGDLLGTPGATTSVDVTYYLENPETFIDGPDTILALPELGYAVAYLVPEPASGLLVGLGLVVLAGRRRSI